MKKILFIPDTHVPYHDERAFSLMLKAAKAFKPDVVVIQGDFADFYSVSSHSKDPSRAQSLEEELKEVVRALDRVGSLGAKRKVFVEGNHEDRLRRYLQDTSPELASLVSTQRLLGLKKRKWEFVPYKSDIKIGKLNLTHDAGSAGRYAVHKALDTYQHCISIGHLHRMCYVVEGNAAGEYHVAASFGWLGDAKQADYMHRVKAARDWTLGFGVGYLEEKSGTVYLVPVPIVNYTCVVEGRLYK